LSKVCIFVNWFMTNNRFNKIFLAIVDWSLLGIVFLVPIYFAWFHENYSVFDLNKAVLLRAFLLIIVLVIFLRAALTGSIFVKKAKGLTLAWLGFLLVTLLSTLSSLQPQLSFLGSYERQQGLQTIWSYLIFFIILVIFCQEKLFLRKLLMAVNFSAAIMCLYGLLQLFGLDFLHWSESSSFRIFSTLGQPDFFGHFLVVMLPITIYSLIFISKKLTARVLFTILGIIELVCLIFTYSRGAWLALVVALGLALLISLWHFGKRFLTYSLMVIVVFSIIFLAWPSTRSFIASKASNDNLNVISRVASVFDFNSGSTSIRLKYWQAAFKIFKEAPLGRQLFGFGPETEASVFVQAYQVDWGYYERLNSFPDRAHNFILDILLQFGVFGFVSLGLLVLAATKPLIKGLKNSQGEDYWLRLALITALLAYTVNNFFSFSLVSMSMILYLLLALAFIVGTNFSGNKEVKIPLFQPISRWLIGVFAGLFLLILFFTYNIKPLIADHYYMQVKKAEAVNNCRGVLDNMEKVMTWYSLSTFYQRIYLFHNINCFSAVNSAASRQQIVRNILEEATSLVPREINFYSLMDLAHTYSILGYYVNSDYYKIAEKYYQKLLLINKNITVTYQDYGRLRLWQGRFSEARQLFTQGLAVTPPLAQAIPSSEHTKTIARQLAYFHDLIGLSYFNEKDFTKAMIEDKEALIIDPTLTSSYQQLADIAYQNKDLNLAIDYNKQAFKIEQNNSLWPLALAQLYLAKGEKITALSYATIAKDLEPANEQTAALIKKIESSK